MGKDEAQHGECRTKRRTLGIYDHMQTAIAAGQPYPALLSPTSGPPTERHGNLLAFPEWNPGHPKPPNWPLHIHPLKEVMQYDAG